MTAKQWKQIFDTVNKFVFDKIDTVCEEYYEYFELLVAIYNEYKWAKAAEEKKEGKHESQ